MKKFVLAAAGAAALFASGQAFAGTLLSQDFESIDPANPSFTTDYAYRAPGPNSMYDEGTWTIGSNPFAVHDLWINGDLPSNALILNGKNQPQGVQNTIAWQQSVANVNAGTFTFSLDVYDVCCNAHFAEIGGVNANSILTFDYQIDGGAFVNITDVTTHVTTLTDTLNGIPHYRVTGSFVVPDAGNLQVSLRSWNGAPGGNDFAVDNIIVGSVPEPASWALMIGGFGFAGAALRRRRAAVAAA